MSSQTAPSKSQAINVPVVQPSSVPAATPLSAQDLQQYSGILPYDAELFGVYCPMLSWYGNQAQQRDAQAQVRASATAIGLMRQAQVDSQSALNSRGRRFAVPPELDSAPARLLVEQANKAKQSADGETDWGALLSAQGKRATGVSGQGSTASAGDDPATEAFFAYMAKTAPSVLDSVLSARPAWEAALSFVRPWPYEPAGRPLPSGVLSPVGLVNLYREYFYQLNTFLGPPVGHVWVSPGGSLELYEVTTKTTTVEETVEASTTETAKSETDDTQQDELSDAVKQDNKNDTKLGAGANVNVNYVGIVKASANGSLNTDSSRQTSSEVAHKHSRTQSAKLSKEITSNYKTTFKTTLETTDTSSRRYVLQNNTTSLSNYELRRKLQVIGVQLQHIGTRLCWQVYVTGPFGESQGTQGLLGTAQFLPTPPDSSASSLQPPDPLPPIEKSLDLLFPLMPDLSTDTGSTSPDGDDRSGRHDAAFGIGVQGLALPDPFTPPREILNSFGNSYHIHSSKGYTAGPPAPGYTLASVRIDKVDPDNIWAQAFVDNAGGAFHIGIAYVWWKGKDSATFSVTLVWQPPDPKDPNYSLYNPAYAEFQTKLATAQRTDFTNATRGNVKALSALSPRPSEDLRNEERHCVFRQLFQQLTKVAVADQFVTAEYIRELFDVDQMLYFVDPDYFRPAAATAKSPSMVQGAMELLAAQAAASTGLLVGTTLHSWPRAGASDYLITEDSQPAPFGTSLGWTIQLDGDERRNEFLNAAWVQAVLPVHPGRELDALAWLMQEKVEGTSSLDDPYVLQPGDPSTFAGKSIREVLTVLAQTLKAENTDIQNTLSTEVVFERGFDPLANGIQVDPRVDYKGATAGPFETFDFWIEVLPTDQTVAVDYDPSKHGA